MHTPEDPKSIARSVEELYALPRDRLREMGNNGLRYYNKHLSRK